MTALGPKPKRLDLYVTRGLTWAKGLRVRDHDGALLDLTGHTFTGKIRKTHTAAVSYNFAFALLSPNVVTWKLDDDVSQTMPVGCNDTDPASKYVYDVLWTRPGNDPICIMKGVVTLNPRIT
jgi:hypothetical protein